MPKNRWEKALFIAVSVAVFGYGMGNGLAQGTGNLAEMDRQAKQAEDLFAQGDPEGAALSAGKAAMMGDILAGEAQEPSSQRVFQAASLLYRAQERGLRALALFERAGGTPPAASGICHFLSQGKEKLHTSKDLLEHNPAVSQPELKHRTTHLLQAVTEWESLLRSMHADLECSQD